MAQEFETVDKLKKLAPFLIQHQPGSPDHDATGCLENDNKHKEVPGSVFSAAQCLLHLCASFNGSKLEELVSIICQNRFDPNSFREQVSGAVDCERISNGILQQSFLND